MRKSRAIGRAEPLSDLYYSEYIVYVYMTVVGGIVRTPGIGPLKQFHQKALIEIQVLNALPVIGPFVENRTYTHV